MRTRSPEARPPLLALMALMALGCPPTNLYRTAEPTPKGEWHATGGLSVGQIRDFEQQTRLTTGQIELGARRGLTDHLDVGVRIFFPGLDFNATYRFVHRGPWSIAVAPQLSLSRTVASATTTNSFTIFPAAVVPSTYRLSRAWAFTLGPSLGSGVYWPETGGNAKGLWLGGLLGAEWRVGQSFWLVPELTAYRVLAGEVPVKGAFFSFGLGARLGL